MFNSFNILIALKLIYCLEGVHNLINLEWVDLRANQITNIDDVTALNPVREQFLLCYKWLHETLMFL